MAFHYTLQFIFILVAGHSKCCPGSFLRTFSPADCGYCIRPRVRTLPAHSGGCLRISADDVYCPDNRFLSAYGRYRTGHLPAYTSADDSQSVYPQFQADHLAFHWNRLRGLPGRSVAFLSVTGSFRSIHHLCFHSYLYHSQTVPPDAFEGKKHLNSSGSLLIPVTKAIRPAWKPPSAKIR
jgi:hypothetical protein